MSKQVFVARLRKVLVSHGYGGRSSTFARAEGECVSVIGIQKSVGRALVAVNLGVYLVELGRLENEVVSWTPNIPECHWRERLHPVGDSDHWWSVDGPDAAEASAADAAEMLEGAMPELRRLTKPGELVSDWLRGWCPGLTDGQRVRYLRLLGK